ncbi:MAG: MBL fold metallo-hydrolase [Candidatus Methanomethylophilaceae archaeon]|nr:MBL fold metallo-hydrolase [Candidatus Methanomethylophilaceae archaeon]
MTVTQVDLSSLYDSNIYFVDGGRKTLLVDTGTGFSPEPSIDSVRKLLNGRKLDYLVLTHRHFDHVGGMARIIKEFSPGRVMAGERDAGPLREGDSEATMGTAFGGRIERTAVEGLKEGDVIDLGGRILKVIETPGHTVGSICLYDEEGKALFTGDLFFMNGVGNTTDPTGDVEALRASLRKLAGYDIAGLYPGHGPYLIRDGYQQLRGAMRMMGA